MEANIPNIRYIKWREILDAIADLSREIARRYSPDVLIAIAKGGLVPARLMLDYLDVEEIGFIEVKFYKGVGATLEKPYVKSMAIPPPVDKNVLVIDDVVDSGRTMQLVINILSSQKPRDIKTSSLFVKPWSTFVPDFYHTMTNEWIVFPWEICESNRENVPVHDEEYERYSDYCKQRV